MNATAILERVKPLHVRGLGTPLVLMMLLAMMVVPLPPFALDLFFSFNIALSLVVLLVVAYTRRPLDFGVFPSLLLIATLLRLALNVASTRVILLHGHDGGAAAGKVIQAFGEFVIGGNYAVGLVVFLILMIINFVVVTKGAGRVSEVSARFTLDAMPGKQMAIDADLNAGLITQEEARERREEVASEADFYGAMDGSSKFVRGDAIAGILILFINIIGGLGVGVGQHGLSFSTALDHYVLLTIGDGLVAQIPSLLLSTAAAIIVTRVASRDDVGTQVVSQLLADPRALAVTSGVLGVMGLIPGMPNLAFLTLAGAAGGGAWWVARRQREGAVEPVAGGTGAGLPVPSEGAAPTEEAKELTWDDVQPVDIIGLEVGYRLIPLVDRSQGGELMARIKGVRRKLSQDLGFLIQPVHIRDNLDLAPNAYRITLHGVVVGEAEVQPGRELAIDAGRVFGEIPGQPTKDPTFGLDAVWIDPALRDQAQGQGYTVVDPATVVATHLSELLQSHAQELLGHEEVQKLLDNLARSNPKLVEQLTPKALPLATILKVLRNLLEERIPIRDIRGIAETLAEQAGRSQDPDTLTAAVRVALARGIMQQLVGSTKEVPVAVLDPELEQLLQQGLQGNAGGAVGFEPGLVERLQQGLAQTQEQMEAQGWEALLLVPQPLRLWLARFSRQAAPGLHVLAYDEVPSDRRIQVVATVGGEQQTEN